MKYIDADLLRKEVKRLEKVAHKSALGCADSETRKFHEGKDFAYQYVGFLIDMLIDSLQQEQPKVDLNEEIERFIDAHYHTRFDETLENGNDPLTVFDFQDIARHFCEFGLRKAAEMYDEIEYNRQIAEEENK